MLYPPLEEGHKVFGPEFCSGYTDSHHTWNSGFYCPLIIPDVPVYCCGTDVLKYCCTIGKGGRYSKDDNNKNDNDFLDKDSEDIPETPNLSSESEAFSQQSLLIGITCGLVAMAALITLVSCFYCSCCLLYKKRSGSQLSGSDLLYGIPPTSSSLTACGLLNYSGNATAGNAVIETSSGNLSGGICGSTTAANPTTAPTLPTLIATSASLNPVVDYWSSNGGSSNSSSVGVTDGGASNTVDTATSLCPPNLVGGSVPHQILHSSVYHHHFTASNPMDAGDSTIIMPPIQHLEPPPPYLAVANPHFGQVSFCDSASGIVPGTRTPQRTNSRGSSSGGSCGQRANLPRRHLLFLQHHGPPENSNVNNTSDNVCQRSNNLNHTASASIGVTERESNNNSSISGRGNLPPPYFVEQYRIRNRVRPPQFQANPQSCLNNNSSSSFPANCNISQRNRAHETIQNLLYPLLNSANLSSVLSTRGQNEGRRRNNIPLDTRSEPRRSNRHNHPRNVECNAVDWGTRLHRSSSDRQQNTDNSFRCCHMAAENSGTYSVGVGRMNNLNNNLSVNISAGRNDRVSGATADRLGNELALQMRRSEPVSENAGSTGSSLAGVGTTGKILNTEIVQLQSRLQRRPGNGSTRQTGRESNESSSIISTIAPAPSSFFESQRHYNNDRRQEFVQMDAMTATTPRIQQACDTNTTSRDVSSECRSDGALDKGERTRTVLKPTVIHSGNRTIDDEEDDAEDDDIMMQEDDDDDEVIAVVTTTCLHQQDKDDVVEAAAVIGNDLEMGFGQEDYLAEEENSEANSIEKLSESATNSSMSTTAEFHIDHCTNEGGNSKVVSGTPSNFFPVKEGSEN